MTAAVTTPEVNAWSSRGPLARIISTASAVTTVRSSSLAALPRPRLATRRAACAIWRRVVCGAVPEVAGPAEEGGSSPAVSVEGVREASSTGSGVAEGSVGDAGAAGTAAADAAADAVAGPALDRARDRAGGFDGDGAKRASASGAAGSGEGAGATLPIAPVCVETRCTVLSDRRARSASSAARWAARRSARVAGVEGASRGASVAGRAAEAGGSSGRSVRVRWSSVTARRY
ncbi:hypothetical protein OJAG_28920 [Oerskovia enterophila]|uniref:Uncharacterized protein n=1 Tax=Oerskovia enterophila TaxID=43678 RepID=A0A163QVW0_9CELL|nr:hypothetical protein OJAG_28920 [Oerskovia enterophila]